MTIALRHPLALAVLAVLASPVVAAQQATAADTARTLDTLVVTGTRVSDRTVAESTSPIDIITPEVLQATGTPELATALSRALPSLNFPRLAISDGSDASRVRREIAASRTLRAATRCRTFGARPRNRLANNATRPSAVLSCGPPVRRSSSAIVARVSARSRSSTTRRSRASCSC